MIKRLIIYLSVFVITFSVLSICPYVVKSFYELSFDFTKWSKETRGEYASLVIWIFFISMFAMVLLFKVLTEEDEEQE